jgi:type VI secretion system protein ImpG
MEVYSVEKVAGLAPGRARLEYAAFGAFSHLGSAPAAFYQLVRSASPLDGFSDTHLSLQTPRGAPPVQGEETISVELTCTNRALPARLAVGDIKIPTSSSPTLAQFRNIAPVTQPVPPPLGQELHWQLVGHLALNLRSLASAEALRALLNLYNFQARADQTAARGIDLKIRAIRSLETHPARRFIDRVPVRGLATNLTLDESRYASAGDAFIFGCVLDRLLGSAITLNSFHKLSATLEPSRTQYGWTPRNGERLLL